MRLSAITLNPTQRFIPSLAFVSAPIESVSPFYHADPPLARRLGGLIQRLKQQLGFTSIVVTHDMRFVERLADTVLFLDEGRAAFFGPLKDFMASPDPHIQQFLTLDAYMLPSA